MAMYKLVETLQKEDCHNNGLFSKLNSVVKVGKQLELERERLNPLPKKHEFVLWHNIQHNLERILSYSSAVKAFEKTATNWPSLFIAPTVIFLEHMHVESQADPLVFWRSQTPKTHHAMLTSMSLSSHKWDEDWPGLNDKLHNTIFEDSLWRGVHADVQLWNEIKSWPGFVPFQPHQISKGSEASKIVTGTSKPPCLLYSMSLEASDKNKRLLVQQTSKNVNDMWTTPEFYRECKGNAERDVFEELVKRVSQFRIVQNAVHEDGDPPRQ